MTTIKLPEDFNYVGAFLTFRCNLNCSYCINRFDKLEAVEELSSKKWIEGLSRIETCQDLPITLGGGEPTVHPGFYKIAKALWRESKHLDLLTNGLFDLREFGGELGPEVFQRNAKYASLRFSFHEKTHLTGLAIKVWMMQNEGYEVGIWGIEGNNRNADMGELCKWLNLDFRLKEFLGYEVKGLTKLKGTYKYTNAIGQPKTKPVYCKGTELLINPAGHLFRCHADLYASRNNYGHILDKKITFPGFTKCENYGQCNPCDLKLKFNRFQEGSHCAVEIKGKEVETNE